MRKLTVPFLVLLLAGTIAWSDPGDKHYGKPITIMEITPLSEIIASPDKYIGKEVHIAGYVYEMCTSSGCWLGVMPDLGSDKMVKIAWHQTDVRFPIGEDTNSHLIEIQGKVITTEQEVESHEAHMAEMGEEHAEHEHAEEAPAGETRIVYLCPMHPDVIQDTEGRCPICKMSLEAKEIPTPTYTGIAIEGIGAIVREKNER